MPSELKVEKELDAERIVGRVLLSEWARDGTVQTKQNEAGLARTQSISTTLNARNGFCKQL